MKPTTKSVRLLRVFRKRQIAFAVLAVTASVFSSAHVPARDEQYLDALNAEAERLEQAGSPAIHIPSGEDDSAAGAPQAPPGERMDAFIQKINSTLYSPPPDPQADEAAYLRQLDSEAQEVINSHSPSVEVIVGNPPPEKEPVLPQEMQRVTNITEAQRKELETELEAKIPGIYRLYTKLGLSQRNVVVQEYLRNERISTASKTILKLYGGN